MNWRNQLGQSMTEYLVVLGVTGAALLAASTDVRTLLSNVQSSYRTQSSEMNKVQIYNNPKLQTSNVVRDDSDGSDGSTDPQTQPEIPAAEYPPTFTSVFDANGNLLGTLNGNDMLVDENGRELAMCQRTYTGQCVFVDGNGQQVYLGASSQTTWVDDEGKPLPLMALSNSSGAVVGFAYQYRGALYNASTRQRLNPQPSNLTATATQRVVSRNDKDELYYVGYTANGLFYEEKIISQSPNDFSQVRESAGELVSIEFEDPTLLLTQPNKYKPCIVAASNWSSGMSVGSNYPGFIANVVLTDPSKFIPASSSECNSLRTVRSNLDGSWTLLR